MRKFRDKNMSELGWAGAPGEYHISYLGDDHQERVSDELLSVLQSCTRELYMYWHGDTGIEKLEVKLDRSVNASGLTIQVDPKLAKSDRANFMYFRAQVDMLFTVKTQPELFEVPWD